MFADLIEWFRAFLESIGARDFSGLLAYPFIWIVSAIGIFIIVYFILLLLHAVRYLKETDKRTNELQSYATTIASQLNQEEERRHQETVAALQDIAKAIRECNEE